MSRLDHRGCSITGAEPGALLAFERALAAYQGWREGAEAELAPALEEAPGFVMAHVLQAYLLACGRDPRGIARARPVLARAAALPGNERERLHIAALVAVIEDDDYDAGRAALGELLRREPRDALALQVAHSLDYVSGDVGRMRDRVAAVLAAWSNDLPGYHAILAMHAFALEENGHYDQAEASARAALALDPADARAHHVMAHVFEMTDRPAAGERWLDEHVDGWAADTVVATHCWWHRGLFQLALGQPQRALQVYDRHVRAGRSDAIPDLIDASALLWRIDLAGGQAGARWAELAESWASHVDDGFCSFNDLHAMLAFVGARDWANASRLERSLAAATARPTRHGETTRRLGLRACRALVAFGRGEDLLAVTLLASLPPEAHRLGGSHAQRDILHLTMRRAVERVAEHAPPVAVQAAAMRSSAAVSVVLAVVCAALLSALTVVRAGPSPAETDARLARASTQPACRLRAVLHRWVPGVDARTTDPPCSSEQGIASDPRRGYLERIRRTPDA